MERHRSMYKVNSSQLFSPRATNYQKARKEWTSKRNDTFQMGRRLISLSPTPKKAAVHHIPNNRRHEEATDGADHDDAENQNPNVTTIDEKNTKTAAASAKPKPQNGQVDKAAHREAHLQKYLAWKKQKDQERAAEKMKKRKPFLSASTSKVGDTAAVVGSAVNATASSFAPSNHIFKVPSGLKDPTARVIGKQSLRSQANVQTKKFVFVEPAKPKPKPAPVARKLPNYLGQTTQPVSRSKPKPVQPVQKPFKPPPPPVVAKTARTAKARIVKPVVKPPVKVIEKKSAPSISITSKAPTKVRKAKPPALKINNVSIKDLSIAETPTERDHHNSSAFKDFLTSTRRKSSSFKNSIGMLVPEELADTISPIDSTMELLDSKKERKARKSINAVKRKGEQIDPKPKRKNFVEAAASDGFKFIEYAADPDVKPFSNDEEEEVSPTTPSKTAEKPSNYMSPFVSVSRGKVNSKQEKEKRNSVYLLQEAPEQSSSFGMSADYRRTMETVRYFRKQLSSEIARLHTFCDEWEAYKAEHGEQMEETGVDMINVTTGQTRLLTSKKLQQFNGLIDQCELGALTRENGSDLTSNDDGAKPILSEDLEGFWSMVSLQIENVEKRFDNLKRWRDNSWRDPDEVAKVKTKKKLTKVTKAKAARGKPVKANSALQEMLKKAHADYMRTKKTNPCDADIILTPTKRRSIISKDRLSTPRRRSMAVLSASKQRLFKGANVRRSTSTTPRANKNEQPEGEADGGSPKMIAELKVFRKSLNLLKTAFMNEQQRRNSIVATPKRADPKTPPNNANARKSILKTPGTKGRSKNVIFNEELYFKSPDLVFTVDETMEDIAMDEVEEDGEEDCNEGDGGDPKQRSYRLRTRRIMLRPSMEIEIPKY